MLNIIAWKGLTHLLKEKQPTFTKDYELFVYKGKLYEAITWMDAKLLMNVWTNWKTPYECK